jgi:heme/copper-type cytochrome/quinol oxidase subunit 2
MRRLVATHSRVFWMSLLVLMLLAVWFVPLPGSAQATTHAITLDATQYEFAPGRVHVSQGDQVVITLTASDVVHGFYLDGYGLEQRVEPGVSKQIVFTADKAGKFRYRCSVSCGPLHPFMIGELVVESNTPFWRAIAMVLVAAGGTLIYLWHTGNNKSFQEVMHGTH